MTAIGILLVFAIVLTAFTPSAAPSTETENQLPLKETDRNSYFTSVYASLIATFPKVLIQDEFGERKVVAYPKEYAGAYIDQSNTLHIVLTKNADITTKANYQKIMGNDKDIIFEIAEFQLSRLHEIQDTLDKVMQKFSIECTAINEITNKVDIHLLDSSRENEITQFLKNTFNDFDDRSIIFMGSLGIKPSFS